jgi:hypothetical protein
MIIARKEVSPNIDLYQHYTHLHLACSCLCYGLCIVYCSQKGVTYAFLSTIRDPVPWHMETNAELTHSCTRIAEILCTNLLRNRIIHVQL